MIFFIYDFYLNDSHPCLKVNLKQDATRDCKPSTLTFEVSIVSQDS